MKSYSQYQAEKEILDQALASGGGTLQFETPGAAVHFRQRVYTLRKIMRENMSPAMSPYDRLTIPALQKGQTEVTLALAEVKALFVPNVGAEPIKTVDPKIEDDDPLLLEARRIAGDIL